MTPICVAAVAIVGESCGEPDAGPASSALARPKSSTLTAPSSRTLTLAGLRSRWITPAPCAASRASAMRAAMSRASSRGIGPRAIPLLESGPLDQLQHQRPGAAVLLQAVDLRDVRVVERREQLGLALEPGQPVRVVGERVGGGSSGRLRGSGGCRGRDRPRPCRPRRGGRRRGSARRTGRPLSAACEWVSTARGRFADGFVHLLRRQPGEAERKRSGSRQAYDIPCRPIPIEALAQFSDRSRVESEGEGGRGGNDVPFVELGEWW